MLGGKRKNLLLIALTGCAFLFRNIGGIGQLRARMLCRHSPPSKALTLTLRPKAATTTNRSTIRRRRAKATDTLNGRSLLSKKRHEMLPRRKAASPPPSLVLRCSTQNHPLPKSQRVRTCGITSGHKNSTVKLV